MNILILGSFGALFLLVAFALQAFGILNGKGLIYNALNVLGAGLLTLYAVFLHSIPFIFLEGIWTLVALWYLVRYLAGKRKSR